MICRLDYFPGWPMATRKNPRGAAARTLALLQLIATGESEFSLKDFAQRAGLAASTLHRLLACWVDADMIERAGPKAYRLGPELFRVAALILQRFEVHKVARPFLHKLWSEWQETTSLCLYKPSSVSAVIVESIPTPHTLQPVFEAFAEIALPWGSMGRVILAHLPPEAAEAVLTQNRRSPLSGKPLPARRKLQQELQRIRQRGYAVYEDNVLDIAGVSAPVFGTSGAVMGCIAVTMPDARFRKVAADALAAAVSGNAQRLSEALGYRTAFARPVPVRAKSSARG
jgi:DNA-binding IclR family transcriptional regulator